MKAAFLLPFALACAAHAQTVEVLPFGKGVQSPARAEVEAWCEVTEYQALTAMSGRDYWWQAFVAFDDCQTILGLYGMNQSAQAQIQIDEDFVRDDPGAVLAYETVRSILARYSPRRTQGPHPVFTR